MTTCNSIELIPEKLRDDPIYPKVTAMLDHIMCNALIDYKDIESKFKDPDGASTDVIEAVINEYGFGYINDIIDTLTNVEINILLHFISLLHLLKGHRSGLQLVLNVLGFEAEIEEWWEQDPVGEPHTFKMSIVMNLTQVQDVLLTLDKIRVFTKQYVYPLFDIANIVFDIEFAEGVTVFAGFHHYDLSCEIVGSI